VETRCTMPPPHTTKGSGKPRREAIVYLTYRNGVRYLDRDRAACIEFVTVILGVLPVR
jgi:hypothetical protein